MKSGALLCLIVLLGAPAGAARADDAPTFRIEFADGKFEPRRLEVPANKTFEIELVNKGKGPAEFESKQLHKEKVLAPGATTTMVIRNLDPGEYDFFDDFHPETPPAVLVAK
ncbi:cupredoxin domain-containing protein [Rhodoblastus acidophilus]|uniref:Cupredoxin domain-containing protein n=1 Tax=Candidatus Rhodoblastus alkanivorans TaxID=2954117 RepID=A0ABS9Z2T2_9HYPH|nr:cupredoxin domain-containing protein [Candidatus Rhodoblastus alkanivorans]MCI4679747.1 cupredoxin domain-containing protein [Candidatus Rhodoblastus alkanivorans]MCI4681985.1 cupredoxin domain-containing protein [Candidatus Rhodoblastus alkanivorans]MDI4643036.1 cupredoxin domain-containing protein [Rhodoblastus acidophilus]